jgi:hypothetical protein
MSEREKGAEGGSEKEPFVRGLLESCESELTQVSNDLKEFT